MYHVLSTWRPELRRTNMLIVVDVSGSMGEALPGTGATKIDLVRQGIRQVHALLPSTAQLGLWQFASQLAPPNDWQPLTGVAPLNAPQRKAVETAATNLAARPVGTGLYDTILGAYRYQQAHYVAGLPNQVILFTDGVNEDDPATISIDQLKAGLAAAGKQKYVQLLEDDAHAFLRHLGGQQCVRDRQRIELLHATSNSVLALAIKPQMTACRSSGAPGTGGADVELHTAAKLRTHGLC